VEKWEDVNDNDDPFKFNWDYYDALYETPKFQKAWEMIHYLNKRGIADNLMVNFMGFAPKWMGDKVIDADKEDEFVEMLVSFFHHAIKTRHLKIGLIAPTNESEHHKYTEGPHLTAEQHARILRKLVERMTALGIMGNIRIVAPDNADTGIALKDFIPAMMADKVVMSKIAHLGFHSYGGYQQGLRESLEHSAYRGITFWITEWNAWCNGCDDGIPGKYDYPFASKSVGFLLDLLRNGARAAVAWEAYDSYYEHHAPSLFSYWGMLGYEPQSRTYFPRKNFYAIQQVSRFVEPGSWVLAAQGSTDSLNVLAFYNTDSRTFTITGINKKKNALALKGTFNNLPGIRQFDLYYTDDPVNVKKGLPVKVKAGSFHAVLPPDCIFTLTSSANKENNK
jgi:O-glycosyl hydrolase